jgi:cytochrome b6-f complex iron-sulfur subunit
MTASEATQGAMAGREETDELSRREFLNYAWLASIGILLVETAVVSYKFALPILAPGEFGGPIPVGSVDSLPGLGAPPEPFNKAKFWWVVTDAGALALYKVCTHLGCIYAWRQSEFKFICPCHGSQFQRDGVYIQGPAGRSLDRFVIEAYDGSGALVAQTNANGDPVEVPPGSTVVVNTGARIQGAPHG